MSLELHKVKNPSLCTMNHQICVCHTHFKRLHKDICIIESSLNYCTVIHDISSQTLSAGFMLFLLIIAPYFVLNYIPFIFFFPWSIKWGVCLYLNFMGFLRKCSIFTSAKTTSSYFFLYRTWVISWVLLIFLMFLVRMETHGKLNCLLLF